METTKKIRQFDVAVQPLFVAFRPLEAAQSTHRLLAGWLDTSEELACIKLSLSLTLIARNQISKSEQSRLIAESHLAG
jgi:hypothetical protein